MHARFLLCTPQYSPSIRNLQCALPLLFLLLAQLMMSAAAAAAAAMGSDGRPSRYESQKRRDWNTFLQYLKNHRPPLELARCSGAHVLEFFRHLDQFGKTKVHAAGCPFFGHPAPPAPCPCPLRQAWGSLDALVGRLRAAFEENGGHPEANPFGARAVRLYLRDVRDSQAKARGITYEKKKRKRPPPEQQQQQQQQSPHLAAPATPLAATSMRYELNLLDLRNVEGLNYGHYGDMITAPGAQDEDGVVMSAMESHNLGGFLPLPVFN